jgi:hypothetical protein
MSSPFRQPYEESLENARPNRYLQLLETGELSSHLDEVCRVADQEFDSIFALLTEETAKPVSSLGKANYLWMLATQAREMVMDELLRRDNDLVPDLDRNDGPEATERS